MPTVPNGARKLTIGDFDLALDPEAPGCDLAPLTFIDAYGLVGAACALRIALASDPDFPVRMPASENMNAHLVAMGFQSFLSDVGHSSLLRTETAFDASSVVVPLQSAADSGGEQALSHLLWEQLRDHVHPQVLETITEGVWEMVGNALEHSGSDAMVMGQVYLSKRGGKAPDHNDLSTTMEQVVGMQGRMVVRSGSAKVSIEEGRRREETVPALGGVIVALSLPLYPG